MISFNFIYLRPSTLKEAVDSYTLLQSEGKNPFYYAGGSEIITMCRSDSIRPGAVIDIKNIPECKVLSFDNKNLHIGSVCTLNQITRSGLFPLMCLACGRIADHTNQCRITLGGNICGTIIYRETVLPLLLSDAQITLYGVKGERTVSIQSVFQERIIKSNDEIILQVHIPRWALSARYAHIKNTTNEKIDYPLVSISALIKDNKLRLAFSGLCSYPFRNEQIESVLNDKTIPYIERAEAAVGLLPERVHVDGESSGEYRLFVLKNSLRGILEGFENGTL